MNPHPQSLSDAALTAEMRAIEAAIDGDNARDGGNELLHAEQANIRRWMALMDEKRARDAQKDADAARLVPVFGSWEA